MNMFEHLKSKVHVFGCFEECDCHSSFFDFVDELPKETMMEHKMEVSKMFFLFKWLISSFHGSVEGLFSSNETFIVYSIRIYIYIHYLSKAVQ